MVDIHASSQSSPLVKRSKLSTRVDLTPLVDLGFLLITFFIFTSAISQPSSLSLNLPDEGYTSNPSRVSERKTFTIIIGSDDRVFYYKGFFNNSYLLTGFSNSGLRKEINIFKGLVRKEFGDPRQATFLIKPMKGSTYKNLVDILDEMIINDVTRYVLMEVDDKEEAMLGLLEKRY